MRTRRGGWSGPGSGVAQSRHASVRRREALSLEAGRLLAANGRLRGLAFSPHAWNACFLRRGPPAHRGTSPPLVDPPFSSWATAPNSLSSWATAPNSRGQRPPTLSLRGQRPPTLVGNGPQLSLSSQATAPTLAGNGPNSRSRGHRPLLPLVWAPPWRAVSHLSSGRPLRPFGWTKLAPTPRGPGPASSWDGYSPRASLVVSLASAGSSRDRAKPGLACTLAVAFSLRGRVALRTRCAR